jgi:hypothetical protein
MVDIIKLRVAEEENDSSVSHFMFFVQEGRWMSVLDSRLGLTFVCFADQIAACMRILLG